MPTLVWKAPMRYGSPGDEAAFFSWLQSIPGVLSVQGEGRELHIRMRSNRVSAATLYELIALYDRFQGDMAELARFENSSNAAWFRHPDKYWYARVFDSRSA